MRQVISLFTVMALGPAMEAQTGSRSISAHGIEGVKVISRSTVKLAGDGGREIRYEPVAGWGETAPRTVRMWRHGNWIYVSDADGGMRLGGGELRLVVPAELRQVQVETREGNLEVSGVRADVQVETGAGVIVADGIGGTLVARTGGGAIRVGEVAGRLRTVTGGGTIEVKRAGGEAWLESGGGDIAIEEAGGALQLSTGAGNLEVGRGASSVMARTLGGRIKVGEAGGLVTVESAGGGIEVGKAGGIRCEAVSGGIRLMEAHGAMHAATARGDIVAELHERLRLMNSFLGTSSGDVIVMIPSKLAVTVEAMNDSAGRMRRIVSDFPEIPSRVVLPLVIQRMMTTGQLNGGGPLLRISARNGTIYLKKQK
ncbi:MAG: hypothetical protein FJW20_03585 [Acidimicrobiia bacterium]|nr:hypothetical protein [Acidimicrobiia bacterium]